MEKKLPSVFANKITKKIDNSQKLFDGRKEYFKETRGYDELSVKTKINRIFNSMDFIYKCDVEIELDNKIMRKTLIGRTSKNLLTEDNELIEIAKIRDIRSIG